MKVKDIIKLVCEFVGESEIAQKFEGEQNFSNAENKKIEQMRKCFNLVNQEIACDYLPFLTKEECDGEIISYENLSKRVIHIYEIKNRFGFNLKFRLFPNYVQVSGKAKTILYSYLPEDEALDGEFTPPCALSERIYAYGVASEYLLIDGVSEDAEIWENRFKDSLFMLSRKRGEHVLPRRNWL